MYEHMRNEFAMKLSTIVGREEVLAILNALDRVVDNYEITKKETALSVVTDGEIPEIVETYLYSKLMENNSNKTVKFYACRLKIFFVWVNKSPENITTNDIRVFLAKYQEQTDIKSVTLDKFRQILNGFFTWASDEGYLNNNPCRNIRKIKFHQEPRRALSRIQLERLRRAAQGDKRTLAIIDTLYSTGCRVSELVNMKLSDINYEEKSIRIIGKGGKYNTCYFNSTSQISIDDYMESRTDNSKYLFVGKRKGREKLSTVSIEAIFRDLGKKCGFKVTPHIIRHTTATIALQNGMKIEQVQKLLGHSSVSTTQIYAETSQLDVRNSHLRCVI